MTFVLLMLWTFTLALFWDIDRLHAVAYTMLGTYLSLRLLNQRTEAEDKVSLQIYMVSISTPSQTLSNDFE